MMARLRRSRVLGWLALGSAVALAIGHGTVEAELHVLFGDAAAQVIAAARILAAILAAMTGAVLVRRGAGDGGA